MKFAPPVKLGIKTTSGVSLTDPDPVAAVIVYDRSVWFTDVGSPPSANSIGAKPGDCYLDNDTGDVYRLESNMAWHNIANIRGPQGTSGGDVFTHIQSSPLQDWTVTHNLGRFPELTIIGSDGNQLITDVEHVSTNIAIVHFATATTGKAVCN